MIAINSPAAEILRPETIRELLGTRGPCLTVFLPPNRPGAAEGDAAALIKTNGATAARVLAERRLPESEIATLLDALKDPALGANWHWSRVIFRSRDVLEQFSVTTPLESSVTAGSCFAIRRLIPEITLPQVFYLLALYKTRVSLFRGAGFRLEEVDLPPGVPASLDESLEFKRPDHRLENRSTGGASTGAMRGVEFGTSAEREREKKHRDDFYKLIDRGIKRFDAGSPLILAGVDEDLAAFRRISEYRKITAQAFRGSLGAERSLGAILEETYAILRADRREVHAAALKDLHERRAPGGFSNNLDMILPAAFDGRVAQLFLNENAQENGIFDKGRYRSFGSEDLLNLAAVETILHSGVVYALPEQMMPDRSSAIAIMRY